MRMLPSWFIFLTVASIACIIRRKPDFVMLSTRSLNVSPSGSAALIAFTISKKTSTTSLADGRNISANELDTPPIRVLIRVI